MFRNLTLSLHHLGSTSTVNPVARTRGGSGISSASSFVVRSSCIIRSLSSSTQPQQQQLEPVSFLRLNNLHDNPGAVKKKRRVGRGVGSGRGKTCGRGHKGQKARGGKGIPITFEGGQTPYWKLIPKRGFKNVMFATPHTPINLGTIQMHIEMNRLDPNEVITPFEMQRAGMFKPNDVKFGVKLLAKGKELLKQPLEIRVHRSSNSAIEAVEALGGRVQCHFANRLTLRKELRPHKFEGKIMPKSSRPPPKYQPYYTSFHKRGYLNPAVQMREWFRDHADLESQFEEILAECQKKYIKQEETQEEEEEEEEENGGKEW